MIQKLLLFLFIPFSLFSDWMDKTVEREFARWEETGITQEMIDYTWQSCKLKHKYYFKRYRIVNSRIYGPDTTIKALLKEIGKKYPLPDVDFIYYHWDNLPSRFLDKWKLGQTAPILISSKHKDESREIVFIDNFYEAARMEGWNALIKGINRHHNRVPWEEKIEKLIWRGGDTDGRYTQEKWNPKKPFHRGTLVRMGSISHPELIDAAFVEPRCDDRKHFEWFQETFHTDTFLSPVRHMEYKYQMIIDGVTCTWPGTQWRLLSGCLSFKQETDDLLWFFEPLTPWQHYIPVKRDLSDLVEKILWAKEHDDEARQIAENGREFALNNLMKEDILLYCYKILCKYAELQEKGK